MSLFERVRWIGSTKPIFLFKFFNISAIVSIFKCTQIAECVELQLHRQTRCASFVSILIFYTFDTAKACRFEISVLDFSFFLDEICSRAFGVDLAGSVRPSACLSGWLVCTMTLEGVYDLAHCWYFVLMLLA